MRDHDIMVRLDDAELARLDEARPAGVPRAVYLRNLIGQPPGREAIADRTEVLALLSEQARAGKVAAAIALARELRADDGTPTDLEDELDRILGTSDTR
ncbi:MAG: hypothetical protein ACRDMH_05225 [Solirubrobacterales bacterium]